MNLKKIFNTTLLLFLLIVPLIPTKVKVAGIPFSADFGLGGFLILVGFVTVLKMHRNGELDWSVLKGKPIFMLTILSAAFLVLSLGSIVYAGNKAAVISEGVRFIEYVSIFYLILAISDRETIGLGFKVLYGAMVLACIIGVGQYILNWSEFVGGGFAGRGRIYATFDNPNYWGAAVNMVIFYPLLNLLEKRHVKHNVALFLLFFFNLFFSSTRGSWLGFCLGLFVIGLLKYGKKVAYLLAAMPVALLIPFVRDRLFNSLNINGRFTLWKTGWLMFRDNPLLGVGNGNYIHEYYFYARVKYKHLNLYLGRNEYSVHNSYLKMFAELGLFGGIVFALLYFNLFYLVYVVYKQGMKHKKEALAFLGFGASYLFQNFTNNLIFIPQFNVLVWVIIGLLYKGMVLENSNRTA